MYSQYQTYHQNTSGGGGTTTVSGQQWNGTSWESSSSSSNVKPGTYSTYASLGTAGSNTPATSTATGNLVGTYTQYYHQWHNRAEEQRKLAQSVEGAAKAEALRQAQWADYYADQSSRAAYHYAGANGVAAPPPVPPAPPQPNDAASSSSVAVQPTQPAASNKSSQDAPGGLKQYVHKCLAQCSTEEERQIVQKEVEKVIAKAIQQGTMHTKNWEFQPLVMLGGEAKEQPRWAKKARVEKQEDDSRYSYYGNSNTSSSNAYKKDKYSSTIADNDSYYGNSNRSKKGKTGFSANYYGKSTSSKKVDYEDNLQVNDSYYGSSAGQANSYNKVYKRSGSLGDKSLSSFDDGDFVPLQYSPKTASKKLANTDGFESSSLKLSKRASRFAGKGGVSHAASIPSSAGSSMQRYMGLAVIGGSKKLDETDYEHMTVKGTCQTLQKEYLRLTAPPRAELVRPQSVLEHHLRTLKQEWIRPVGEKHDYAWFCSQLKAVRQDLTVQRIYNGFAVEAYETHARMALEEDDLNEYNQCQTQLKELYESLHDQEDALKNCNEFIAYRLIYYVFLTGNKKYQGGSSDLFKIMLSLTPEQREDPCIRHALRVRVAVAECDYHLFFRLLESCPKLGAYLMNYMVQNVRHWALQRICKAYRPSVSVPYVLREIGFDPDASEQLKEGIQWLTSCGCVLTDGQKSLLCKESTVRESDLAAKTSLI